MTVKKPPARIISSEPKQSESFRWNRDCVFYNLEVLNSSSSARERFLYFLTSLDDSPGQLRRHCFIFVSSHFDHKKLIAMQVKRMIEIACTFQMNFVNNFPLNSIFLSTHSLGHRKSEVQRLNSVSLSIDERNDKFYFHHKTAAAKDHHRNRYL